MTIKCNRTRCVSGPAHPRAIPLAAMVLFGGASAWAQGAGTGAPGPTVDAGAAAPTVDAGAPAPTDDAGPPTPTDDAGPSTREDAGVSPHELEEIEAAVAAQAAKLGETLPSAASPVPTSSRSRASVLPDLSFVADAAFAWFSGDPMPAGAHDPKENGFALRQLEVAIQDSVDPYLRFDGFVVVTPSGVEIEELYATTLALPHSLQARAGLFLTRFGRLNASHPHAWSFVDQPFALGRVFGGEGNRGAGVELSWLAPLDHYTELVFSVTDANGEATARSFFGPERFEPKGPLDFQLTFAVKQFFELSDDWSLLVGVSAANGPNPTGHDNRTDVYGVDLFVKYRPLAAGAPTVVSFQTEWLYRRRQVPADVLQDANGYAELSWRFKRRWGTAARYEYGSPSYDAEFHRAVDYLDPFWLDHRHRVSANTTFWPTEFSRLRLQGAADVAAFRESPVLAIMLNLEFMVGAHGAHPY